MSRTLLLKELNCNGKRVGVKLTPYSCHFNHLKKSSFNALNVVNTNSKNEL